MSDERPDGTKGDDVVSPGGGPKRVVSERSVDDILESLSETEESEPEATKRTVDGEPVDPSALEEVDERSAGIDDSGSTDTHIVDGSGTGADEKSDAGSIARSIDEDLAARVDAGEVTGADVRAAESGDGRDSTPEIDEIDLSLEDVDGVSVPEPTSADGQGDASKKRDDAQSQEDEERGGLITRVRNLFSR